MTGASPTRRWPPCGRSRGGTVFAGIAPASVHEFTVSFVRSDGR